MATDAVTTVAVVLAGGTGSRLGSDTPKQLLAVAGRTVLEHTLRAVAAVPAVERHVLVMHPDHLDAARRITERDSHGLELVPGGSTRAASVRHALDHLAGTGIDPGARVLVHDGARPLVGADVIARCLAGLDDWSAVTTVIDAVDSLLEATADGRAVASVVERSRMRLVQTPQGFHFGVLAEAHRRAAAAGDDDPSDDAQLVLRYLPEVPVGLVAGDRRNLKVTHPADLAIAAHLLDEANTVDRSVRGRRP